MEARTVLLSWASAEEGRGVRVVEVEGMGMDIVEGRGAEELWLSGAETVVVKGLETVADRGTEIVAYSRRGTHTRTQLKIHLAGREPWSCRDATGRSVRTRVVLWYGVHS